MGLLRGRRLREGGQRRAENGCVGNIPPARHSTGYCLVALCGRRRCCSRWFLSLGRPSRQDSDWTYPAAAGHHGKKGRQFLGSALRGMATAWVVTLPMAGLFAIAASILGAGIWG